MLQECNAFRFFSTIGRRLAELHLNYETGPRYPIFPLCKFGDLEKMFFKKPVLRINDKDAFIIPNISYAVGGRTPIEWMVDRYRYKVDKVSGIVNDSTYDLDGKKITEKKLIEMVQRLVYVGLESDRLVALLSLAPFEPDQAPETKTNTLDYFIK